MRAKIASLGLVVVAAACGSTAPKELIDARSAYDEASHSQATQLVPADIHAAHEALARAENSFAQNGDGDRTRDLAYAAQRASQLAEAKGRIAADQEQTTAAKTELDQLREQQVRTTSAELATEQQALARAEQQRADAERRARQAASDLARIASVKQESRGMVISIPSSVLFQTAKYDLLGPAQAKLSQVTEALTREDPDSTIVVEGYTDSQGSLAFNEELSQHRAEAVRTFLTSHGIASDRVTAKGLGPSNPVADNATAEGRADNRRVDIVVQPKGTHGADTAR
jgi:outer membrane protein OmpA-like peptidoglycan-associated protein